MTHRVPVGEDDEGGECDHCHSQDDNIVLLKSVNLFPVHELELYSLFFFLLANVFFLLLLFSMCCQCGH